jgi:magnesium-transporting ATPase (P-type)
MSEVRSNVERGSASYLDTQPLAGATPERRRPHPMPIGRRLLMMVIVLGVLAAFSLLVWIVVQIRTLTDNSRVATADDVHRAAELFRILAWILSASVVGVAIWIGHFALRIRRSEVYPPPGSRHIRVHHALRGEEARRVANICMTLAVLLLICGLALAPLVLRALSRLGLSIPS